eukprot:CAMPEP_0203815044 /NCGR_PEP_ID=MMETSP0115-20131106/7454_1 /ASSEMBLY_ACC=CAM_ASM_000227 /TAXON_ID=33651 /ORGANISM="Bicosoecid sp, Strain ms1" /LENGTH=307 /DNA_ID=CAMNT_0050723933 /DNA_START=40 /DNA_END=963 /DNA_ORIENTATION=-
MATRNLTLDFSRLRNSVREYRAPSLAGDARPLMDSSGSSGGAAGPAGWGDVARAGLPPLYVDLVAEVNEALAHIEEKMRRLDTVHRSRLTVTFDDREEGALEEEIDILTREITRHFGTAGSKLKQIHAAGTQATSDKSADSSVRRNIQRNLAVRMQTMSGAFRKAQKTYMARLKSKKAGGVDLLGTGGAGEGKAAVDTGFSEDQMSAVALAESTARERDQEIINIAKSIEELASIFKELATLVIDQGTVLDRIDYNMELVVERTRAGVKELEKAEEYQKSSRPKKCIGALLVLITIMVIILVLKNQK